GAAQRKLVEAAGIEAPHARCFESRDARKGYRSRLRRPLDKIFAAKAGAWQRLLDLPARVRKTIPRKLATRRNPVRVHSALALALLPLAARAGQTVTQIAPAGTAQISGGGSATDLPGNEVRSNEIDKRRRDTGPGRARVPGDHVP